jgi:4-hydroxy-tetrahydrodipicolinate reductase
MKIAIIGQGNTGQYIEGVARDRGHEIVEIFDIDHPLEEARDLNHVTCIDFSVGELVRGHVRFCAEHQNNIVIGTTGWYDELGEVTKTVEQSDIGCLYSPNFALGVNLFFRVSEFAAQLYGKQEYDFAVHEEHHSKKADSPSGTALEIGNILLRQLDSKDELMEGNPPGKIGENQLHVSSTRIGDVFGNHEVVIDGANDVIRLSHSVKSRRIFAEGAVIAAEWMQDRTGLFTIHDLIDSILEGS